MCEQDHVYICLNKSHAAAVLAYMRSKKRFDGRVSYPCITMNGYITYVEVSDLHDAGISRTYTTAPIVFVKISTRPSREGFWLFKGEYLFCDGQGKLSVATPSVFVTADLVATIMGELSW